ncbi:hypothetical protein [Paenibacillus odorifer]|uniref:Uncharacterized protein n=1 Tax=Paenibacillus odorifer TaxID=189426 RepID=A0AAD0P4N4_9BACL|nr:hypothetical protein [Paenibacillus odorifer]AWV34933.1 hypothetical protein CD191_21145 [Paenibacillus odorifer]
MKINKKQRNLLINSSVTGQFPWLINLLKAHEKIELEDVEEAFKSDFINVVPFVLKHASEEWKGNEELLHPVEDLGSRRIQCALCGTKNKVIFYIKNKVNGIKLNVGSDCINDFVDFEKEQYGKTRSQLIAGARKVRRMADANKHFEGIDQIIETWESRPDTYEVLIPNSIRRPYLLLLEQIKEKYEGYLNLKYNESTFDEIRFMFAEYFNLRTQMSEYESTWKEDKFVVTKSIVSWLKRNSANTLVELLRETGMVTKHSIEHLYEKGFIKRIEKEIINLLQTLELDIEGVDYENEQFVMSLNVYAGGIWISCPFKKVVEYFGAALFNEKPKAALTLKNLLKISDIYKNTSKEIVVQIIDDRFNQLERSLRFRMDDRSLNLNELDIVDITKNRVLVYNLNSFLNIAKTYVVEEIHEEKTIEDEKYFMNLEGRRFTAQELHDIRNIKEVV